MVETILEFLQTSLKSLILAINGLFWPAVGFSLFAAKPLASMTCLARGQPEPGDVQEER